MVADELSNELDSCRQWMIDNKLTLHLGKTEAILFGTKRKLNSVQDFSVKYNGKTINNSSSVKYLGVNLDNTLSGESIASNVIKKASGRLKFLYRHSNCLNFKSRKTLSSALIMCHFDYACSSWYSAMSQKYKKQLQILQNKVVRFILDIGPRTHIGQNELDKVGMLSTKDRIVQLKLNHVFKIFNDTCPHYLKFDSPVFHLCISIIPGVAHSILLLLLRRVRLDLLFIALLFTIGTHCQMRSRASVTLICSRN